VFGDISVKTPGTHRLRFTLMELQKCASVFDLVAVHITDLCSEMRVEWSVCGLYCPSPSVVR